MGCGEPDLQLFRSCRISISFDDELAQWHVGQGPSLKSYTSYTMELVLHQFRTCAEHAQNTRITWVAQNMRIVSHSGCFLCIVTCTLCWCTHAFLIKHIL